MTNMKPEVAAAYEAMKAAESVFRATRTEEAQAAYRAANAAYNAIIGPQKKMGRACRAGMRQHQEQAARTAAAVLRHAYSRAWR